MERRSAFWFVLFLVDFLGAFVELILNRHGSVRDHGAGRKAFGVAILVTERKRDETKGKVKEKSRKM